MLQPDPDPNERFRLRRAEARRRRAARRVASLGLVALAAAGVTLGGRFLSDDERGTAAENVAAGKAGERAPAEPSPRPVPAEMRGVHVTMALVSLPGKLDEYLAYTAYGMNAIEIDVKDENGDVAFPSSAAPLAREIGAVKAYYRPRSVLAAAHRRGLYAIARVVVFEDPVLAERRPSMAIRRPDGEIWKNDVGLAWTNPYDRRVWEYNVGVAEAAARAGFDEIMFDYVRFPSDGAVESAVFPGRRAEAKGATIARFLAYARARLHPLGVRVSAAVFGLAATRNLGIGQRPALLARQLDAVYPMVYPSHYRAGEYNLDDPSANPRRTVTLSLRDFRRALRNGPAKLIPWLQDFSLGRTYTAGDVLVQVDAARRVGTGGFLLWNANGVYTAEALSGS